MFSNIHPALLLHIRFAAKSTETQAVQHKMMNLRMLCLFFLSSCGSRKCDNVRKYGAHKQICQLKCLRPDKFYRRWMLYIQLHMWFSLLKKKRVCGEENQWRDADDVAKWSLWTEYPWKEWNFWVDSAIYHSVICITSDSWTAMDKCVLEAELSNPQIFRNRK